MTIKSINHVGFRLIDLIKTYPKSRDYSVLVTAITPDGEISLDLTVMFIGVSKEEETANIQRAVYRKLTDEQMHSIMEIVRLFNEAKLASLTVAIR